MTIMAQKRKATSETNRQPKRLQHSAPSESSDIVDNGDISDFSSQSSYCLSHGSQHETPITPHSPASSRYPSDRKTHLCPYEGCFKAFNRPARLTEHLRSHTNERIFSCTYEGCEKTFLRASHLSHHVKSAHTTIRDYICDREGCGKTFVTGSRLRRHLAAHEGRDKYRCTEYPPCNETFRKHSTLQKHILTAHLNEKPFPCPHIDPATGQQCTQAFDTAGHLRSHESRIHGGARFACIECSSKAIDETSTATNGTTNPHQTAVFPTYALLQAHMKSVHPPTCPECGMTSTSSRDLRRHLEITHGTVPVEERKIHPCLYPSCGRNFTKKGNLNVHMRTVHEGEKRFVCGETDLSSSKKVEGWNVKDNGCGKRYGSKLALEEHVRTAHLGLKNAKAERRELLGLNGSSSSSSSRGSGGGGSSSRSRTKDKDGQSAAPSNLAMLTGEGYMEESGRHIPCLLEQCAHLFHRDYDLWLHMASKHNLEENDIQILFMQRAMQGGEQSFDVDFDKLTRYGCRHGYATGSGAGNGDDIHPQDLGDGQLVIGKAQGLVSDEFAMADFAIGGCGSAVDNGGDTDMTLIDPVLTFTQRQQGIHE
ncbi:C2H2 transcription factor [Blastomyces dermatitidis ER-3]|uniref:C2H2 transcription factor n=1 Tax=Ajellomyces dermatitidis (strain ER-3 / ATCC MYA-2586) TaxID=559297 RepID=A0ABP2ERM3_AJEDR|nr:C2H2 transcription factor [Blastomyces dermatitidis ER-3]EEQ86340.2 C2H2 transcription factor [Blastomyces dermatitidis ER-3]